VDRRLVDGGTLFNAAESFAVASTREINLPARQPDRAARTATVEMRFGEVEICRPRDEQDRTLPKTVRLRLVEVREIAAPEGAEPLHWRLLTTHEVADAEKAWEIVGWYQARWTIEQLFRVMKSQGLQLEDSQLASADRLVKLTAPRLRRGRLCDKSRLHRYTVGPGTRRQAPVARIDRLHRTGDRNSRSAQPDA
jgi:hypothetical protein